MKDYLKLRKEELKKCGAKGFTMMDMPIIAVLIAIAIPIFASQLENSREATDAANLRSAYATASAQLLTSDGKSGISAGPVAMTQATEGWTNSSLKKIGPAAINNTDVPSQGNVYVNVTPDGSTVTFTASAASGYTVVDPTTGKASTGA